MHKASFFLNVVTLNQMPSLFAKLDTSMANLTFLTTNPQLYGAWIMTYGIAPMLTNLFCKNRNIILRHYEYLLYQYHIFKIKTRSLPLVFPKRKKILQRHLHASPKCKASLDLFSGFSWLEIDPRRILIRFPIHNNIIIIRKPLPRAVIGTATFLQIFRLHPVRDVRSSHRSGVQFIYKRITNFGINNNKISNGVHRLLRKIMIIFNDNRIIAFGDNCIIPNCPHIIPV